MKELKFKDIELYTDAEKLYRESLNANDIPLDKLKEMTPSKWELRNNNENFISVRGAKFSENKKLKESVEEELESLICMDGDLPDGYDFFTYEENEGELPRIIYWAIVEDYGVNEEDKEEYDYTPVSDSVDVLCEPIDCFCYDKEQDEDDFTYEGEDIKGYTEEAPLSEVIDNCDFWFASENFTEVSQLIASMLKEEEVESIEESVEVKDIDENTFVKEAFAERYPDNELTEEINDGITFYDVFECLDTYCDIYELLGVNDSTVREGVFILLAEVMDVDYEYIYEQWMKA